MVKGKMDRIGVGLVCALLLLIQYGNGEEISVTSTNPSLSLRTGDTINLTISYNSTATLIVWIVNDSSVALWQNGEPLIAENYKNRLTLQENQLSISGSTPKDSGNYTVKVYNGSVDSGSLTFVVKVNDKVPEIQSNVTGIFKTGENIILTIEYKGDQSITVWEYNGSPLILYLNGQTIVNDKFRGRTDIKDKGSLVISNTTSADAGNYTVTVTNNLITASQTFQVKFYDVITSVTVQQTPAIVDESTPEVNLFCSASSGSGSVTWQKDGQPLTNDSTHVFLDQALKILNPNRTFSGNYSCNMSNPVSWNVGLRKMIVYYPVVNVKVTQSPGIVSENTAKVELSCSPSSGYIESVTWTKNGKPIANDDNYSLLNENQTLKITKPNRTFSGLYSCNISNAVYFRTGSLLLSVYGPVENIKVTQSPKILDGNSTAVNLSCNASSNFIEAVTWTKDGVSIKDKDTFTLLDGNHTLQIFDPNRTFSGLYSCKISNQAYWNTGFLKLIVYDPVENIKVTQSPKILDGNSIAVNLSCNASSNYIEAVTWTKDGVSIEDKDTFTLLDGNHTLQIIDPNRTFSGLYSCKISNQAYWNTGFLKLIVYDPVENVTVTQSPEIANESSPVVKLSCNASSGAIESVTWKKDGEPISINSNYNLSDGNQILHISKPNRTFSGLYSCNISNAAYWSNGSLQLRVYDPVLNVKVTQSPDKVDINTPLVTLTCNASSGYTELVAWTKDGQPVINKSPYSLSDGNKVLTITEPNKTLGGIYTCKISNAAYWESGFLNLTVSGATLGATSTFGMMIITLLGGILLAH